MTAIVACCGASVEPISGSIFIAKTYGSRHCFNWQRPGTLGKLRIIRLGTQVQHSRARSHLGRNAAEGGRMNPFNRAVPRARMARYSAVFAAAAITLLFGLYWPAT